MIKLIILTICSLFFIAILQDIKKEYAFFIKIAFIILSVFIFQKTFENTFSDFIFFSEELGIQNDIFKILLKTFMLCTLTQITSNICVDCKENAMANIVELGGRFSILILSIPLAEELFGIITRWIAK